MQFSLWLKPGGDVYNDLAELIASHLPMARRIRALSKFDVWNFPTTTKREILSNLPMNFGGTSFEVRSVQLVRNGDQNAENWPIMKELALQGHRRRMQN